MSNVDDNVAWLDEQFSSRPWFSGIEKDTYGRYIVNVKYMNDDVNVPDYTPNGKQILCHFAYNKNAYVEKVSASSLKASVKEHKETSLLQDDLYDLQATFGDDVENVFYEIIDGDDAITNMSSILPVLRSRLDELYSVYGFDALQEIIG